MYFTNKIFKLLTGFILFWCSVGAIQETQAQCQSQITSAPTGAVCPNTTLNFTGTGQGLATAFDFNSVGLPPGWTSSAFTVGQPCNNPAPDGTDYFWASAAGGVRFMQSNNIDASLGGNLNFEIDFGDDDPSAGCENVDANEGVFLQYSINGGANWVDIQYFDPTAAAGGAIGYDWVSFNIPIPAAAQTTSTMFRWVQLSSSGAGFDNWGMDNISLLQTVPTIAHSWDFGDGSPLDASGGTVSHTYTANGVYTVTYAATVVGGCTNSVTTTITVSDTQVPTITAPANITVNADAGLCTASPALGTATGTDNCGTPTFTNDATPPFAIGITTVTWTADDGNGNTATATQTVTVVDNQDPTITAPAPITVDADAGLCTASPTLGTATGSDNCSFIITDDAPATFPVGITTVTWTATDPSGNTATATQTVTVVDIQAPVLTVPANISVNATAGSCGAVVNYTTSATDNCDVSSLFNFTTAGATGATGPSQAQIDAAYVGGDLDGQVTSIGGIQEFTVPITGSYLINAVGAAGGTQLFAPGFPGGNGAEVEGVFNLTAGHVIRVIVGQKGEDTRATSEDNAAPGGGGGSFVWNVTTGELLVAAGGGGGGGRGSDAKINANLVTSGNDAFNVVGNGGIGGNGGTTNSGGSSYWAGAGAGWLTDGTGGNNATNYNFNPNGNGAQGGRHPLNGGLGGIRFSDTNDEGGDGGFGGGGGGGADNMGTGGGGGYSGGGGGRGGGSNASGGGGGSFVNPIAISSNLLGVTNLGNGLVTIESTITQTQTAGLASGSIFPVGTTTNTFTATDEAGNTSAPISFTVTVTDNQDPTITAPAPVTANVDAGSCTASGVALGTATGTDNCSFVITDDAPATFPVGITTVTWTATDPSGNTATATQTVTVSDNQDPTITAPAPVTANVDAGSCTASGVALGTATGTDNCSFVITDDAPATFPVGITTVTWTATDPSGNTATATQTVTISDNQDPTITAPANVTTNTDAGLCTASGVALGTATGSDNCSFVITDDAPATFPVGITTVTWTATDPSGNTATATQTVTVNASREIDVLGNAVSIADGSTTPSATDDTDFGNVGTSSTRTYTIANTGTDGITITSITSDNGEFVVSNIPATVAAGATETFDVTFTPTSPASQTAIITINNNDCDEAVYDFVVQGRRNPPTPLVPLPPLPIAFTATAISTTQINLEWDLSNSPNITSYRVYQGSVLIATLPRSATTFEVVGLNPDTFYSYHLIAVNQVGSDTKISNPVFDNDWTFPEDPILGSVSAVCGSGQASVLLTSTAFIYNVYESLTATTPILQTDGDNNFALPSVSQTTTFYISVLGKDPVNVKESGRIAVTVQVEPTFESTILGENSRISCESSLVLEAEEVENATYIWLRNGSTVGTGQSFTATFSGDYQVITQRGVCRFTSDKVNVKLNFAPIATIQQGNQGRFCEAGTLNATQTNSDATYEWILNGATVGQGTTLSVTQSGTYTLQVTQNGCQASTEINVVVAPTPQTPTLEATESTICPNTETVISVQNAENGVTYQWFRNGSNLRQTGNSISTSIQGNYQVRAISNENTVCSSISEEVEINLFEVVPVYLRFSEDKTSLFVEDVNLSQSEIASVEWYFEGELNASLGSSFEITPTENGRYSARVTNQNGCVVQTRTVDFTVPQVPVVTGEEDLTSDLFKIYPNPSTGAFKIQFPIVLKENIQMTIFDGIGRAIHTQQLEKGNQDFSINIEGISKGMYMIHFNQNGSTYSKQIIIE